MHESTAMHTRAAIILLLLPAVACSDPTSPAPVPVAELSITVSDDTLEVGTQITLGAVATNRQGQTVPAQVVWESSDTTIASVDPSGRVLGRAVGQVTIVARSEAQSADTVLTVVAPVARIDMLAADTLLLGDTLRVPAVIHGIGGGTLNRTVVTWTSSDTTIATVDAAGLVQTRARGQVLIRATAGRRTATLALDIIQFVEVVPAWLHVCAIAHGGDAYCWLDNDFGRLGSEGHYTTKPRLVSGGRKWRTIQPGAFHTCALTLAGEAYCWGNNRDGQLGIGVAGGEYNRPQSVVGGLIFESITAGRTHTCGVVQGGDSYCWGSNSNGEIGDGSHGNEAFRTSPTRTLAPPLRQISAGLGNTCGVSIQGPGYCWGFNHYGESGDYEMMSTVPKELSTSSFVLIATGGGHSCGLTATGVVMCWGAGHNGMLGYPRSDNTPYPHPVAGNHRFSTVSTRTGAVHTCALAHTGEAYCWGDGLNGALGVGASTIAEVPTAVHGGIRFVQISAGSGITCGVSLEGVAYCWGVNGTLVPTRVPSP